MNRYRPTWVEISLNAFSSNLRRLKETIGADVQLLAVLKADAYGHGAEVLAPLAVKAGATFIGVSSLEEGVSLRNSGISAPILILGGIYPLENFSVAIDSHLTPTVASFQSAKDLSRLADQQKNTLAFHLKVDTGMGRIGVSTAEAKKILKWLAAKKNIQLTGVYTHLSCADADKDFTKKQLLEFSSLKKHITDQGFKNVAFHAANSAGCLRYADSHHEMVRPGLILYGVTPFGDNKEAEFSPVLSWQTKVIFLKKVPVDTSISYGRTFTTKKDSTIATLPVGYADGVPRTASNKGFVLIRGLRCPIVGMVTMDHIMIDVTNKSVSLGDPVLLIGHQGKETLTAWDWARWAGTNPYEILCGISKRVPRVTV